MLRLRRSRFLRLPGAPPAAKPNARTTLLFQNSDNAFSAIKEEENHEKAKYLYSLLLGNPIIHQTQQVHSQLLTTGLLNQAILLFNTLLRCYSLSDEPHLAFLLYNQLQQAYCFHSFFLQTPSFDSFSYTFLANASTNSCCILTGRQFHSLIIKVGFHYHVYVQTALVKLYSASGVLGDAFLVFAEMPERNSVTWNMMIAGLVKWDRLEFARSLFDEMPEKNIITWTEIIDGYVRINRYSEGLALFQRMFISEGIKPSGITILAILPAISNMGELKGCRLVHGYGEKSGCIASDIRVTNSIIDTYAKCGCIMSASRLFEEISVERKNLVSWTSIISGFAMHGMGKEAVENFDRMEETGLKPNRVTFLSVLNACSHGGLVEEGLKFYEKMVNEYQIVSDIKHYGCLVDMLGRTGRLEEAEKLALEIPNEIINVVIWRTLLGACSFHGNIEMAQRVSKRIMQMERGYGGDYVLMHNIFAGVGRFEDAEKLRRLMDQRNALKVAGQSLV